MSKWDGTSSEIYMRPRGQKSTQGPTALRKLVRGERSADVYGSDSAVEVERPGA